MCNASPGEQEGAEHGERAFRCVEEQDQRSELLPEWSATAREDWRGDTVLPTDEFAVSSRKTLMELTVPVLPDLPNIDLDHICFFFTF